MSSSQFDLARQFGVGVDEEVPAPPPDDADVPWGGEAEVEKPTLEPSDALWNDVPKVGDTLPKGTRIFKAEGYSMRRFDDDLNIRIMWRCQEEPLAGRIFSDSVPYVDDTVMKAANAGDRSAREVVIRRLQKAKTIMDAAGVKRGSFTAFLDQQPELKIALEVEAERRNINGKWVSTEGMRNRAVKYLGLNSPAGR